MPTASRSAPALAQAEAELQQISATFDALLRIAQIETGARRARFVPTDLGAVLDRIADAYVDVAEERGQSLTVTRPARAAAHRRRCRAADAALRQPRRERDAALPGRDAHRRRGGSAGDRLVLTCADDGPGIPEDERGKVFQRLYRIDKSRTTPGSGLGLSLVKAIAELHGAEVALGDNAPGLLVTIGFPVVVPARLGPGRGVA